MNDGGHIGGRQTVLYSFALRASLTHSLHVLHATVGGGGTVRDGSSFALSRLFGRGPWVCRFEVPLAELSIHVMSGGVCAVKILDMGGVSDECERRGEGTHPKNALGPAHRQRTSMLNSRFRRVTAG